MTVSNVATLAGGCYWGVEAFFMRKFKDAITSHQSGFMGGVDKDGLTYAEVKKGDTGHAEVFHFTYDPAKVTYEQLLEYFFRIHNSTTPNQHEYNVGTNYRSVIFYHDDEQKAIAEDYIKKLDGADKDLHEKYAEAFGGAKCITTVEKAGNFYPAHEEHQDYLEKNPNGRCAHRIYF